MRMHANVCVCVCAIYMCAYVCVRFMCVYMHYDVRVYIHYDVCVCAQCMSIVNDLHQHIQVDTNSLQDRSVSKAL